ncbi:hypothetical protein, partial [Methanocalculus natronophilus]|uniref:hypothetical protein n=1 Tax=Methanocalculus natronophilus TaxID=1262400 RepID=UPI0031B64CC4
VEGVVTHVENEENFYIQNNQTGDGLYVRLSEPIESIEQGHKVTVFGWSNIYTGFGNNHHSIREAEVTSHDSTQHEIFITKEMSVNEIIEAYELFDEEGPGRNTAPYTNYRIFKLENVDFISPVGQWNRLVDPAYHNQELSDATQGSDGEVHLAYDPSTTNIEGLSENTLVEGET